MKTVSRFEANLLRILHGFFGRTSSDQVLKLVQTEIDCPNCLNRNAVDLVKDTLQKGVPMYLAQQGGWRRERFLRNEQISEGRLWDRTPPEQLGLSFSQHSLRFLMWITANDPNRSRLEPGPAESQLTVGDRLLYFLAFQSLRGTETIRGLMDQAPFQNHALLWLACLADMGEAEAPQSWDFSPAAAREAVAAQPDQAGEQERSDHEADGDQDDRREAAHRDAGEHERAAPHRDQREQQEPVAERTAGHRDGRYLGEPAVPNRLIVGRTLNAGVVAVEAPWPGEDPLIGGQQRRADLSRSGDEPSVSRVGVKICQCRRFDAYRAG
jgi:hypothetical protein